MKVYKMIITDELKKLIDNTLIKKLECLIELIPKGVSVPIMSNWRLIEARLIHENFEYKYPEDVSLWNIWCKKANTDKEFLDCKFFKIDYDFEYNYEKEGSLLLLTLTCTEKLATNPIIYSKTAYCELQHITLCVLDSKSEIKLK